MRSSSLLTSILFASVTLAACGDDGGSIVPDAPPRDIGFNKPTGALKANREVSADNWMEIGPANLSCLGTASADVASTVAITINTKVEDFQSGNAVPNTVVAVFKDQNIGTVENMATSDGNAMVSVVIPVGTKRFGYKMTNPNALDTLLLNQTLDSPSITPQSVNRIQSVSTATGATLPALIGVSRSPGTGVLAGAVRDCGDPARTAQTGPAEISNFIATVSSTPDVVTHLDGVDTYYFNSSVGLPVRHSQKAAASENGIFMAIEMQPNPTAYIQVWGYKTDADVAADNLTLIAQLRTSVIAETVITGSYEPLRTN